MSWSGCFIIYLITPKEKGINTMGVRAEETGVRSWDGEAEVLHKLRRFIPTARGLQILPLLPSVSSSRASLLLGPSFFKASHFLSPVLVLEYPIRFCPPSPSHCSPHPRPCSVHHGIHWLHWDLYWVTIWTPSGKLLLKMLYIILFIVPHEEGPHDKCLGVMVGNQTASLSLFF